MNSADLLTDPVKSAKRIRKLYKRLRKELPDDAGLNDLLIALSNVVNSRESLTATDQDVLLEYFGQECSVQLCLLTEEDMAINRRRASNLLNWWEVLIKALRDKADRTRVLKLVRRVGVELVNALADRDLRS